MKKPTVPNSVDRVRLAAEAVMDPKTIQRAYRGITIRPTSRARIEAAAKKLGMPPPGGGR